MSSVIENSQTPIPVVSQVTCLYSIKEWLAPNLRKVKNHTKPHAFKFQRSPNGTVECHYKMWARDFAWKGPIRFLRSCPSGVPSLLRPCYSKQVDLEVAKASIVACFARLRGNEILWWEEFLERSKRKRVFWSQMDLNSHVSSGHWILSEFEEVEEIQISNSLDEEDAAQKETISQLLSRQTIEPEVRHS